VSWTTRSCATLNRRMRSPCRRPLRAAPDEPPPMSRSEAGEVDGRRELPAEDGVIEARPDASGGAATPSFADRSGESIEGPAETRIGSRTFTWGARTYVMGIVNVTPDSFSGDGLLVPDASPAAADPRAAVTVRAVGQAGRMAAEGADLRRAGGQSP